MVSSSGSNWVREEVLRYMLPIRIALRAMRRYGLGTTARHIKTVWPIVLDKDVRGLHLTSSLVLTPIPWSFVLGEHSADLSDSRRILNELIQDTEFLRHFERVLPLSKGAFYHLGLLYVICRVMKPTNVIETGVASGASSAFILLGLDKNQHGTLYSIDLPDYDDVSSRNSGVPFPEIVATPFSWR